MQRKQCLHIIQNIEVLGEKKGKSSRKSKKGINHMVKDFKAEIGKNMPCRRGGELDEKRNCCRTAAVAQQVKKPLDN